MFSTTLYFYTDLSKTWIFALCLILWCISAVFCDAASRCLNSKWEGCDDRLLRFTRWIPNRLLDNFHIISKRADFEGGEFVLHKKPLWWRWLGRHLSFATSEADLVFTDCVCEMHCCRQSDSLSPGVKCNDPSLNWPVAWNQRKRRACRCWNSSIFLDYESFWSISHISQKMHHEEKK